MCALEKYTAKRKFTQTKEPKAKLARSKKGLRFVVQRHAASRLHYDFRLEMDGVLKSWAVPKGPSLNPSDKRLAVMVEDHPYSYRNFEGTIPKGNYGAGEVEIWDEGNYEAIQKKGNTKDESILLKELEAGSLKFYLHGKKLQGEFALVKIKADAEENAWLLIKHKDEYAEKKPYNAEEHVSKRSRVTAAALLKSASGERKSTAGKAGENKSIRYSTYLRGAKKLSSYIKPMLATAHKAPFDDKEWVFEIKWDGYRAIAEIGNDFRFYSRNGLSYMGKFPSIISALKEQEHEMILDGEIVAYDKKGLPDFQSLQNFSEHDGSTIIYHVFDLLHLNGHSTAALTLLERKELLKEALIESDSLKFCDHVETSGKSFFKAAKSKKLEGVVAKKIDSEYAKGIRSSNWLKIKWKHTEDVIIAGFTKPRGSRSKFGALILGRYDDEKELQYAGHAGSGFNEKLLKELYGVMEPLVIKTCPFKTKPKTNTPATWVQPVLVAEIEYTALTRNKVFRHPVFIGLRPDKMASEVVIEADQTGVDETKVSSAKTKKAKNDRVIKAGGREVTITNQNKIYWPGDGYTKGDMVEYYRKMSRFIVPYLKGRPENLNRFPYGIDGESFYHKDAGANAPSWVSKTKIFSESNQKEIEYIICNDAATLLYLANLGCIEMNPWNSTVKKPEHPTYLIVDIDPSENNTFDEVIDAALATKEVLDSCGAACYCKTSGASGIHIFVPMGNKYDYEQVKTFAHLVSIKVVEMLPDTTTLERSLNKRDTSKIYIDYLQNRRGQTISSAYSVRPRAGATVSAPLDWTEVRKGLHPSAFTIKTMPARVAKKGDIFKPVLGRGVDLKKILDRFGRL